MTAVSPDTKAARIMALGKTGRLSSMEIARIIQCSKSYVRVVLRQRCGQSRSKHDEKYRPLIGRRRLPCPKRKEDEHPCVALFFEGGLTYAEAAQRTGLNRNQVAGHIHRARKAGFVKGARV